MRKERYVSSTTLPFDTARALRCVRYVVDVLCGWPKEYTKGKRFRRRRRRGESESVGSGIFS